MGKLPNHAVDLAIHLARCKLDIYAESHHDYTINRFLTMLFSFFSHVPKASTPPKVEMSCYPIRHVFLTAILALLVPGCHTTPKSTDRSEVTFGDLASAEKSTDRSESLPVEVEPDARAVPDLSFLPDVWVSDPMRGPADIPFEEVSSEIVDRLRAANFKPIIFPYRSSGGGLAFSREVGIPRLEVQELGDGRFRVRVRVQNVVDKDIAVHVICEMTDSNAPNQERFTLFDIILAREVFRDFSFIMRGSPEQRFAITVSSGEPI